MTPDELRDALRLIVITDRSIAAPRSIESVAREAIEAGARVIQLRDKQSGYHELLAQARRILTITRPAGAFLVVNDRVDVALAARADGVHIGPDDLPLRTVCAAVPDGFIVGYSTDDPDDAEKAEGSGATYIGCGAVFGTSTKDVGDEVIGLSGLDSVARTVSIPVVGIGGMTPEGAERVATETSASGVAAVRSIMGARDIGMTVRRFLEVWAR